MQSREDGMWQRITDPRGAKSCAAPGLMQVKNRDEIPPKTTSTNTLERF
jgi:hypothetical protein